MKMNSTIKPPCTDFAVKGKKSKITWFPYAHWNLSNKMAKTPERTMELMMSVWEPAVAQVHKDVASMQKIVDAEGGNFKISPWDYRYYSEKVRKEKYDLDQNVVKEYLQLNLREGMFWVAGDLICSSRLLMFLYTMLT
jgi:peptidyl-dipeptidase Dcp